MKRWELSVVQQAKELRSKGYSYQEINTELGLKIPKPTYFHWFRSIILSKTSTDLLIKKSKEALIRAQKASAKASTTRRVEREVNAVKRNTPLYSELENINVRKIVLGILYAAEGTKSRQSGIVFGNSDPSIIMLFLNLLRTTYPIDEKKFRVTVQARADQDLLALEIFWSKVTGIRRTQFYTSRVDPRSVGKASKKAEYKGVCRLNYFSVDLLNELLGIGRVLTKGP